MLIHHYGFDDFSIAQGRYLEEWWTAAQRLAYWNAIAPYNVAAIFTGHLHVGPNFTSSSERFISWTRPNGAAGGPPSIPTFVSGAARGVHSSDLEKLTIKQQHEYFPSYPCHRHAGAVRPAGGEHPECSNLLHFALHGRCDCSESWAMISPTRVLRGVLPVFQTPYHADEIIDYATLERENT